MVEIGIGLTLLVVPGRLRWSRRSCWVLRLGAIGLIGIPLIRRICGMDAGAERAGVAFVGLTFGGAQYLLSEEESSVRGAIAAIGGGLVLIALSAPGEEHDA